jgi:hypothetical protein
LTGSIDRILSNLSPFHIGFLGLVLSVFTSAFADRLVVTELSFPLSPIPLALVIGCGYACPGWQWNAPVLPYWLVAMTYGLLSAAAGNLIHRAHQRRSM